jgi:LmbE family N-acetylglucosaminyl deacetylase
LPNITNNKSKILLFEDDSSIIITKPNPLAFINKINKVLTDINEWIEANLFSLNVHKTYFMQFSNKNISLTNLMIKEYLISPL